MKQVHLLPESRKMQQDHQKKDLQPWNRFTYNLKGGKCHKTISKRTFSHATSSLTGWKQVNATRPSERRPAAMKQVHLLPECRQMQQYHQQVDLQPWNRFSYMLKAGKCHKTIRKRSCSHATSSLTPWKQANVTRPLARGPAAIKQIYLQSESSKYHNTISKGTCSHEKGSLTGWKRAHATRPSERGPAAMNQVHLPSEHR